MLAKGTATNAGFAHVLPLPLDLRAALEFIVSRCGSYPTCIEARIAGHPELTRALMRYAPVRDSRCQLIALGNEPEALWDVFQEMRPECVLTLVSGPLAQLVQPLRSGVVRVAPDLPGRAWRSLGFERVGSQGFYGPGAMGWAASERGARALGRPDLADRSRFAMQRRASSSRAGRLLSTVLVREYRRVR